MLGSILLSAIPPIAWLFFIAVGVVIIFIYWGIKSLWVKMHTLEGPIDKSVEVEGNLIPFKLFKEKRNGGVIFRIVTDQEIKVKEAESILASLSEVEQNDVYFHGGSRVYPPYITRINNIVKYIPVK